MINRPKTIRVMLVDDHAMVRRGLATFLSIHQDIVLAGEAGDGQEALEICETVNPDVILMDLVMPRMDGLTAIRAIHAKWPDVRIITLTSFGDQDSVKQALQAGSISYLLKNVSSVELAEAIRAACAGQSTLAPEATRELVNASKKEPEPGYDLTPREQEVLHLLVEGCSNPDIARRLSVSRSTARAHVSQILSKFGVSNRAEAIAMAFRCNLVN